MSKEYHPQQIENQAQSYWAQNGVFFANPTQEKVKFYCLSMFPYPSGQLHMGHVRNYTIGDVFARYYRQKGFNVMQPMGWDAFGLPAENAAIQKGIPPAQWTYANIEVMRGQLKRLGLAIDWQREITTCRPEYYRWEQWLFLKMMEKGLVYKKTAWVNWDPVDQTVLANEQVIDGRGWRSGALVEKRQIPQYFMKITAYAEELLQGLLHLPGWPEEVKAMQRNWIGKSEGAQIIFPLPEGGEIKVFTTRPDTIFGVTFLAVAPEHHLAQKAACNNPDIAAFLDACKHTATGEALLVTQEKKGMPLGMHAIHPLDGRKIPIWVGNYVLAEYGEGAVMGVPAHDERDFEFASHYGIPIIRVIDNAHAPKAGAITEEGALVNSGHFNGLASQEAKKAITEALTQKGLGQKHVQYRLHDWGISRQRYWGCPIPIIHCDHCGEVPARQEDLPIILPENVTFHGAQSPLKDMPAFYATTCPQCGRNARRETDTMDTFVESSWYYARYASFDCQDAILDQRANDWLPVDQYVGGIEHAVLHLLYARFLYKVLRDFALVPGDEPFTQLLTQGMVLKDGAKMSKSKGNTVDPQYIFEQYGADTARLFITFAAPPEQALEWSDAQVEGAYRFLRRLWRLVQDFVEEEAMPLEENAEKELRHKTHQTIAKVSDDIERRHAFNTAIAAVMELVNALMKTKGRNAVRQEGIEACLLLLYPFVPHICHEAWQVLKPGEHILDQGWPIAKEEWLTAETIHMAVQVNGKTRGTLAVSPDWAKERIEALTLEQPFVQRHLTGAIVKIVFIPGQLINIVTAR